MTDHHDENDGAGPFHNAQADADRVVEPEPSESIGMLAPRSKTPFPDAEHAVATHYAYDPQTFEILCRPGQRLTQKKAQRLQELQLYEHVVSSAS